LLKRFADTDGRVFRLDIHSSVVTKPPPRKAASGLGFNKFDIEGQIVSFEEHLEKIETKVAPVLKQIIEARSLSGLSSIGRKKVAYFVAAQSLLRLCATRQILEEDNVTLLEPRRPKGYAPPRRVLGGSRFMLHGSRYNDAIARVWSKSSRLLCVV
jgi:hypothetical protein